MGVKDTSQADKLLKTEFSMQPSSAVAPGKSSVDRRTSSFGVPREEMTPAVTQTISALLERIEELGRELKDTRLELAEISRIVDVDCLAPIPNRRAFMRRLNWAIAMHQRYRHPSTILYFDLNDFKYINDTFGHAAGDAAIQHVCTVLHNAMRESDFIARIGGDEFGIIMYYADETSALRRGNKIVQTLRSTPFVHEGKEHIITAALGAYSITAEDSAETALANADKAMYEDKRKAHGE